MLFGAAFVIEAFMHFLLTVLGCIGAIVLMCAGLGYVFAPGAMHRLLKSAGAAVGFVLAAFLIAWDLARAAGPFLTMLVVAAVIVAAYAIRARRVPGTEHRPKVRSAERTPVMPRHLGDGL
jgi:hypothetical protein